jgi:hypothetical protein
MIESIELCNKHTNFDYFSTLLLKEKLFRRAAMQPVVYMQNILVNMNKNHTFLLDKDKKLEDKKREFAVTTITMNW